ncbi:hypothetical protein SEA_ROSCOE_2 [Mycobacterium phage Roscoe]|uniref:Uncharacterized protein n=1 Tax=Mycobacterium phage Crownjwl TaxID=2315536 RepID=A0A386KCI5_9CAUD|nr:hypothetical protein Crownjwl_2 [Mycobacterium phage Crownjwl]AZS09913.1 hypothetical protein SEA_ROSCOE_2 [Mycobacterium phage Roscoe]AZS11347.1 hypothetical protein SEA_ZAIDER_2 [Mycobacterium phage Zaider]WKW85620.1 hypothetical protein SEA_BASATO_2 [Mycobacterium phage Basato]
MRETSTATTWSCDGVSCTHTEVLTGGMQAVPPSGWRILKLMPTNLNLALEPLSPSPVRCFSLCPDCWEDIEQRLARPE